jgi:hypothetical protein
MTDDRHPHELLQAALQRLHDCSDVLRAIAAAARLLVEQLDLIELDIMELTRLAADTPPKEQP